MHPSPLRTERRTVRLHRAQQEFRHSPALFRGFIGGRGSGKTFAGAYDLIRRAMAGPPGATYAVGSPTYTLLDDITLPAFTAIARDLGVWRGLKKSPRPNVQLARGVTVRFRSAEEPDKLRGPNWSGCWLDEASLMAEDAYTVAIGCLREGGRQGWLSATFTPKGFSSWTYEVFGRPRPDVALFRAHTRDNPFNPPGFADTLALQYGPTLGRQELAGEFVALDGAEWPAEWFEHAAFWFDDWPANLATKVLALDPSKGRQDRPGDYSAFVRHGVAPDGTEYVEADLSNRRDAQAIVQDGINHVKDFRPDRFACEVNSFQELFEYLFQTEAARQGVGFLWEPVENYGTPKEVRIRRLTLPLAKRTIRFKRNSPGTTLLVQQLRDFPAAEYRDGPDALEMARRVALKLWEGCP